jgi:hypothetical protein
MKNFRFRCSTRKHIQHILNPNAQAPNTSPTPTLPRIESDATQQIILTHSVLELSNGLEIMT